MENVNDVFTKKFEKKQAMHGVEKYNNTRSRSKISVKSILSNFFSKNVDLTEKMLIFS